MFLSFLRCVSVACSSIVHRPLLSALLFSSLHGDLSLDAALVNPDSPICSFSSPCKLEEALQDVQNDELYLRRGFYFVDRKIELPQRLKLTGDNTIVYCNESKNHIAALELTTDSDIAISNLQIENCSSAVTSRYEKFYIFSGQDSKYTGRNIKLRLQYVTMRLHHQALEFTDIQNFELHMEDCHVFHNGHGIILSKGEDVVVNLVRVRFFSNQHSFAVHACSDMTLIASGCFFTDALMNGVYADRCGRVSFTFEGTKFSGNRRGMQLEDMKSSQIYVVAQSIFERQHHAVSFLRNFDSTLTVSDSTFQYNKDGSKSGVYVKASTNLSIDLSHVLFYRNHANAMWLKYGTDVRMRVSGCIFKENGKNGFQSHYIKSLYVVLEDNRFVKNHNSAVMLVSCNGTTALISRCSFEQGANGVRLQGGDPGLLRIRNTSFMDQMEAGVAAMHSESHLDIGGVRFHRCGVAGVHLLRSVKRSRWVARAEVYLGDGPGHLKYVGNRVDIVNTVATKNGLCGFLLQGLHMQASIADTSVSDNEGIGIFIEGADTGNVTVLRTRLLRNAEGLRFHGRFLAVDDSEIIGSNDGLEIRGGKVVVLRNVTITDNARGVTCKDVAPDEDVYNATDHKWVASGFIYLNSEHDRSCEPLRLLTSNLVFSCHASKFLWGLAICTVLNEITLMLPPVLQKSPEKSSSFRAWWRDAGMSARIVTLSTGLLWIIMVVAISLLHLALAKRTSSRARGVRLVAMSIALGGVIFGLLGRFVSEAVMRKWTLMNATWIRKEDERVLLAKKIELQKQIRNVEVCKDMADLQHEARKAWRRGQHSLAESMLMQMKDIAQLQNMRLGAVAQKRRALYDEEGERMDYLLKIPSESKREAVQGDVPEQIHPEDNKGYAEYIHEEAEWFLPEFTRKLCTAVDVFNRVRHVEDLVPLGLLPPSAASEFTLPFEASTHKLKPERRATVMGEHCGLKIAHVKRPDRALAKTLKDYGEDAERGLKQERPLCRYVCDWLRATVITEDPYTLALLYAVFGHILDLVRVKNNFANEKAGPIVATNLLANYVLHSRGSTHIVEIQFLLQDFLTIKMAEHDFYDVLRAKSVNDLCAKPIFDYLAYSDDEEGGDDVTQSFLKARVGSIKKKSANRPSPIRLHFSQMTPLRPRPEVLAEMAESDITGMSWDTWNTNDTTESRLSTRYLEMSLVNATTPYSNSSARVTPGSGRARLDSVW